MRKILLTLSLICISLTSAFLFTACKNETPPATIIYKQLAYYQNGTYYEANDLVMNYYEASDELVKGLTVRKADDKFKLTQYVKTDMKKSGFTLLDNKNYAGITYKSDKNVYVYALSTNDYVIVEESTYPRYEQETLVNFFSANRTESIKCTNVSSAEHEYVINSEFTLKPSTITVSHLHTKDVEGTYNYKTYDSITNEFEYTLEGDDSFSIFVKVSGISLIVRDNSGSAITYTFK